MPTQAKLQDTSIETTLNQLENVLRIENFSLPQMQMHSIELTHSVYEHDAVYGQYVTVEEYIDCPPEKAFEYLADSYTLGEWTYSTRKIQPDPERPGQFMSVDAIGEADGEETKMFFKTITHKDAMTVDFHCAWDQGDHLWMIYLMRIIPAELVLGKPGCVITWTNCHHPNYDDNPFPNIAPKAREHWVGDLWPLFYAGHYVELQNLKHILEYRFKNNLL